MVGNFDIYFFWQRVHLIVQAKVHGVGVFNYFVNDLVVGGANITIEVLRRTLMYLWKDGILTTQRVGKKCNEYSLDGITTQSAYHFFLFFLDCICAS